MKKAGLIDSPARATFMITNDRLEVLKENPAVIDNNYLMKFESFREFQGISLDMNIEYKPCKDIKGIKK